MLAAYLASFDPTIAAIAVGSLAFSAILALVAAAERRQLDAEAPAEGAADTPAAAPPPIAREPARLSTVKLRDLLWEIEYEVPAEVLSAASESERADAAVWARAIVAGANDPPERPAWLEPHDAPRCRRCGCTDCRACPDCCSWAEPDLCSECFVPRNLRELVEFLGRRPLVTRGAGEPDAEPVAFVRSEPEGLHFLHSDGAPAFVPVLATVEGVETELILDLLEGVVASLRAGLAVEDNS